MKILFCYKKLFRSIVCACKKKLLNKLGHVLEHLSFRGLMILLFSCSYISYAAEQKKSHFLTSRSSAFKVENFYLWDTNRSWISFWISKLPPPKLMWMAEICRSGKICTTVQVTLTRHSCAIFVGLRRDSYDVVCHPVPDVDVPQPRRVPKNATVTSRILNFEFDLLSFSKRCLHCNLTRHILVTSHKKSIANKQTKR